MKNQLLTTTILLLALGCATFIGCNNQEEAHQDDMEMHSEGEPQEEMMENHEEEMHEEATHATYQCPMKCEGEKTYDEAGQCPTCGMDLKEME